MTDTIERQVRDKLIEIIKAMTTLGFDGAPNVRDLLLEDFDAESWNEKLFAKVDGKRRPRLWAVDVGRVREESETDQCYKDTIVAVVKGYYRKSDKLELQDDMSRIVDEIIDNGPTLGNLISRIDGHSQPSPGELPLKNEYSGLIITLQTGFVFEKMVEPA